LIGGTGVFEAERHDLVEVVGVTGYEGSFDHVGWV